MPRKSRTSARAAEMAAALRTPTPQHAEPAADSDDEMVDAPATPTSPHDDVSAPPNSAPPSDGPSEPSTPATPATSARRRAGSTRRRGRLGRPPKNKVPDRDQADEANVEAGSEPGTPFKRRRGRPPMGGGGRWGRARGGPSHISQTPVDRDGNVLDVVDDEVLLPEDPEGEAKVDKLGRLLGGRQYRCRTFTVLGRGERLYMLSTEPARCMGFRDSYLFFQKHKQLFKIVLDDAAKRDLIERELIPHSYKGRAIGVVTARSVFREFGARIVVAGKRVLDDYEVAAARANGEVEGELADPLDPLPRNGEPYNQNQYVAWHGASSVYHSGPPNNMSLPPGGKSAEVKRKKVLITEENWMLEHARAASEFNSELLAMRRSTMNGVYDIHTNMMHYPAITQPTHARWEAILPSRMSSVTGAPIGVTNDPRHPPAAATTTTTTSSSAAPPGQEAHDEEGKEEDGEDGEEAPNTIFPPLDPAIARNYLVVDTVMATPPTAELGQPYPDEADEFDMSRKTIDDVPDDIVALLPPDCRKAFDEVREQRRRWREQWRAEIRDGARGQFRSGYQGM